MLGGFIGSKKLYYIEVIVFLVFLVFWTLVQLLSDNVFSDINWNYSYTYGFTALTGGILGIIVAQRWGGMSSLVGKSLYLFSIGLLLQALGQFTYTFYVLFLKSDVPYPSLGDIGYFGSIPFYAYGIWLLGKVSGSYVALQKHKVNLLWILLVPAIILYLSYKAFLVGYVFDWNYPWVIFFDFGYPLGQAYYISLAILAYILTRKTLGGIMKVRVLLILFALVIQYVADYMFLYQFSRETWHPAGLNELIYLLSYFLMGIAILGFYNPLKKKKVNLTNNNSNSNHG